MANERELLFLHSCRQKGLRKVMIPPAEELPGYAVKYSYISL